MNNLYLRSVTPEDIPFIAKCEKICFSDPWSEKSFSDIIKNDCFRMVSAVQGADIIGYLVSSSVFDEAEILNIAVLPEYRRRGIARFMLTNEINSLSEMGISKIFLECRKSNSAAQGLYKSMGFAIYSVRKNYYTMPTEDAYLMQKTI